MLAARKSRRQPDLERARLVADALRAEQELRHPTEAPIEDLAWLLKATVHDVPLEGTEGRLVTSPDSDPVIEVSTRIRYPGQRRFVIAHELGHLLLHANRNESRIWDGTATRDRAKEREADIWASNWLMPHEMWQPRVGAGVIPIETIDELIDEYRVSLHAATIRVVELTSESCCVVYVESGRIRWARPSMRFKALDDAIWPGRKLNELTFASQHAAGGEPCQRVQTLEASAWLRTSEAARQRITEFCWSMPSDGASLSLLWLHQ